MFVRELDQGIPGYGVVRYHDITSPIIAQYVAVEGVQDEVFYNGIRMELYGCGKYFYI